MKSSGKIYFVALMSWVGALGLIMVPALIVRFLLFPLIKYIEPSSRELTFMLRYSLLFVSCYIVLFLLYSLLNRLFREQLAGKSIWQWFEEVNRKAFGH